MEQKIGIRAYDPSMPRVTKSLWSLLVPWHSEWLATWIYIIFALYFWVEAKMIRSKNHVYHFKFKPNWDFMFLATLGIAISLTATAVFLIFYSINKEVMKTLRGVDYMGRILMIYLYTFSFLSSELVGSKLLFPL